MRASVLGVPAGPSAAVTWAGAAGAAETKWRGRAALGDSDGQVIVLQPGGTMNV